MKESAVFKYTTMMFGLLQLLKVVRVFTLFTARVEIDGKGQLQILGLAGYKTHHFTLTIFISVFSFLFHGKYFELNLFNFLEL